MQIQLLSNQVSTKTNAKGKPYQELEVAYKNLTFQGKVESKKLFDFGAQADAFKTLVTAMPTSVFDVEVVKNGAGYNDWTKVTKGESLSTTATVSATTASRGSSSTASQPSKGNWETPEERKLKQIYIVRQSSLSVASQVLSVGQKTPPDAKAIIELAKQFEEFVFSNPLNEILKDSIESLEEDPLPF